MLISQQYLKRFPLGAYREMIEGCDVSRSVGQPYLEVFPLEGEEEDFQLLTRQGQPQVVHVRQWQRPLAPRKLEALLLHRFKAY